jgi:hypothetical protein
MELLVSKNGVDLVLEVSHDHQKGMSEIRSVVEQTTPGLAQKFSDGIVPRIPLCNQHQLDPWGLMLGEVCILQLSLTRIWCGGHTQKDATGINSHYIYMSTSVGLVSVSATIGYCKYTYFVALQTKQCTWTALFKASRSAALCQKGR